MRDRVYAFLSLAHKWYGIIPGYTMENTVIHVLINTAQKIVEFEKTLGILDHASQGREKQASLVPSWVPDWTSPETDCGLKNHVSSQYLDYADKPFTASKGLCATVEFREDRINETSRGLKAKGVLIDRLDTLEEPLSLSFRAFYRC